MTRTVKVSSHTRRLPEKAPDPLTPVIEARRKDFARKWGVELVGANDDRLAAPIADPTPAPSGISLERHTSLLNAIAKMMGVR